MLTILIYQNQRMTTLPKREVENLPKINLEKYWNEFVVDFSSQEKIFFVAEAVSLFIKTALPESKWKFESMTSFLQTLQKFVKIPEQVTPDPVSVLQQSTVVQSVFEAFFKRRTVDAQSMILKNISDLIPSTFLPTHD